eukprot:gene25150-30374_t
MNPEEPNLLSHLNDVRFKALPEGGLTSVIYCGKVRSEQELMQALQVHRIFVEEEVNKEEVNVTGLLMGQGNAILHLLEGPCYSVLRILNNLANHDHFDVSNGVQSGSIVFNTEDRPRRFFPEWYSCIIQEQKSADEELTAENYLDVVFEMATKLLDIGTKLRNEQSQEELEISKFADRLPGRQLILALSAHDGFFSLPDFAHFYFDPYHATLESERSWPLERLVRY